MSKIIVENVTRGMELMWRSVKVKKSLDNICHTLELEIPPGERLKVNRHNMLRVSYENPLITDQGGRRPVTTVRVDEVVSTADSKSHVVKVIGRSPARDIIDSTWTHTPADENGFGGTLHSIAKQIADRFNISCTWFPADGGDPTSRVGYFAWQNESPWMKLLNEADSQGFLFTSNERGGLYVWKCAVNGRDEGFRLDEGKNIKTIEWRENGAEQYRTYVVTGHLESATVVDETCPNNRILTIDMTNPFIDLDKLERRAETEKRRRKETCATVTVPGWALADPILRSLGTTAKKEIIWSPNFMVPVNMPSIGLSSEGLLISEVEHEADAETFQTTITLVRREAYA